MSFQESCLYQGLMTLQRRMLYFSGYKTVLFLVAVIKMRLSIILTTLAQIILATSCKFRISRQRQLQIMSGYATNFNRCELFYINAICTEFLKRKLYINTNGFRKICLESRSQVRIPNQGGQFKNSGKSSPSYKLFNRK